MRGLFVLCLVSLAAGVPQNGIFSGLTGAFNNLFSNGNRRPPPQRRPQPQFQQQQQQQFQQQPQQFQQPQFQQQQQPAAPAFVPQQQQQQFQQPRPQFSSQPSFQQPAAPQPQFQQPQQQFNSPPTVNFNSQPSPSFSNSNSNFGRQPAQNTQAPAGLKGGTSVCAAHAPTHDWTDPRDGVLRRYVVTWQFKDTAPCKKFTQGEAKAYCNSMDMEPVSLDSPAKQDHFNALTAQDAQRYFWTGGIVDHAQKTVFWSNGRSTPIPFANSAHWSHTGGAGLPQPDNRAAGEVPSTPEVCLGILNNFYADGIKWHDVACHHRKPTICEPRS